MKTIHSLLALSLINYPSIALSAANTPSDAYQAGHLAGKVFIAILIALIIKKIFFTK